MTEFRKPPPPPKWATYINGRRPEFKMHAQWGHVRSAIGASYYGFRGGVRGGRVYEWDAVKDDWTLIWDVPPGTLKKDHQFFLGTKDGPQDVEKMKRREEAQKKARIAALEAELERMRNA
jgi:hypothetical protein